MIVDQAEYIGEPGFGIDAAQLGDSNEGVNRRGALASPVGAGEQPVLAADGDTPSSAFGGVIGGADTAVVQEPGKAPNA